MNAVVRGLLQRRSVRTYQKRQILDEELRVLLECGLYAPSGGGLQKARFLVVQDAALLEELNRRIRDELAGRQITGESPVNRGIRRTRAKGYQFIYGAPTLIAAAAPGDWENALADCACALENIWLAASAIGLGACWSNQPHWLTDEPAVRELFERIGLRDGEDICGAIGVGYPASAPSPPQPRKENRICLDNPRELGDGLLKELWGHKRTERGF